MAIGVIFEHSAELFVVDESVRSRADNRHLALEHVPELRQFVDAGASQEAADAGDAFVADRDLADVLVSLADGECAQLENLDDLTVQAAAALPVDDRSVAFELDGDRGEREDRQGNDDANAGDDDVLGALHQGRPAGQRLVLHVDETDLADLRHAQRFAGRDQVGRQVGDDVDVAGGLLELAHDRDGAALCRLRKRDDDVVDIAGVGFGKQVFELASHFEAFRIDAILASAIVVNAEEVDPGCAALEVIVDAAGDRSGAEDGD